MSISFILHGVYFHLSEKIMIPHSLKPSSSNEISVKLILEMKAYCESCIKLHRNEQTLRLAYEQNNHQGALSNDASALTLNEYIVSNYDPILIAAFKKEHEEAMKQFSAMSGESYWFDIKEALLSLCDENDPNEKILKNEIQEISDAPLAIQTLNKYFIEFLKNSMDAIIKRYLADDSSKTTLEMGIKIMRPVTEDNLKIVITDNAHGFPQEYISSFSQFISEKKYLDYREEDRHPSEKNSGILNKEYYFGGSGHGMHLICKEVYRGEESSITINNTRDSTGAEITLTSTLKPTIKKSGGKYDSPDRPVRIETPLSPTSRLFQPGEDQRRKVISKTGKTKFKPPILDLGHSSKQPKPASGSEPELKSPKPGN